jgi:hypothetical protein
LYIQIFTVNGFFPSSSDAGRFRLPVWPPLIFNATERFCQMHVMMPSCYDFVFFVFLCRIMPSAAPSSATRLFLD